MGRRENVNTMISIEPQWIGERARILWRVYDYRR